MLLSLARARRPGHGFRRFHLFRGPDKLALTPGSRAARARDALKGAVERTVTADGLWHLNRLAILATCNPAISWEGLRVMLTGTSVLSLVYFGVSGADPKPRKMLWSALFVALQGAALAAVVADLVPAPLAPDERRCFEANFEPYGLRSAAFRALLRAGDGPRDAAPGDALLREGRINERLHLVLAGRVGVWRGGERLALVDADAGDRGALFGEVGYLFGERRDSAHYGEFVLAELGQPKVTPSRMSVVVDGDAAGLGEGRGGGARVVSWDKKAFRAALRELDRGHHDAEAAVKGAFAAAAMEKMRRTQVETLATIAARRAELERAAPADAHGGGGAPEPPRRRPRSMVVDAYGAVAGWASRALDALRPR